MTHPPLNFRDILTQVIPQGFHISDSYDLLINYSASAPTRAIIFFLRFSFQQINTMLNFQAFIYIQNLPQNLTAFSEAISHLILNVNVSVDHVLNNSSNWNNYEINQIIDLYHYTLERQKMVNQARLIMLHYDPNYTLPTMSTIDIDRFMLSISIRLHPQWFN